MSPRSRLQAGFQSYARSLGLWALSFLAGAVWAGPATGESVDFNPEAILQSAETSKPFLDARQVLTESAERRPDASSRLSLSAILSRMPGMNVGWLNKPGDPINLVFLGDERRVYAALADAGWTSISNNWFRSIIRGATQAGHREPVTEFPPMEPFWIDGKREDSNWAIPVDMIKRHHFRLWRTDLKDELGRTVWWGSASYDNGVNWSHLTHATALDRDEERGYVDSILSKSSAVESRDLSQPLPQVPLRGINSYGEPYQDDGRVLVVSFR